MKAKVPSRIRFHGSNYFLLLVATNTQGHSLLYYSLASYSMAMYQLHWCVHGYHVYRDKRDVADSQGHECVKRENKKLKDPYTAVLEHYG